LSGYIGKVRDISDTDILIMANLLEWNSEWLAYDSHHFGHMARAPYPEISYYIKKR
jgi:hypothetical protein